MVNKKKRADVFIETSAHSLVHPMRIPRMKEMKTYANSLNTRIQIIRNIVF